VRHSEIEKKLSKNRKMIFTVTDFSNNFETTAKKWFGRDINFKIINY